jgi:hypothetical protein
MQRLTTRADPEATGNPERIVLLDGVPVGTVIQPRSLRPLSWVAYDAVLSRGDSFRGAGCGWGKTPLEAARTLPAVVRAISDGQL